jgi:hypothetical protein
MALTKVSFSMITGAPVNPLDFGATGTGAGNDTAGLQAAINACPVGGLVYGGGLTYRATGVTINKAITVEGVNILMFPTTPSSAKQDAFTITHDNVTLLNCGATITQAALPAVDNSAGVFCEGYDNIVIDGGTWDGSIDNIYTPGNYRGVIFIKDGVDCVVQNTITKNADGEGLWMFDCTRPQILNNKAYNAAGSGIVCNALINGLIQGNLVVGPTNGGSGNSGMALAGNINIIGNTVLNASGAGIAHGEGGGEAGGLIADNYVKGHGSEGTPNHGGILSQGATGLVVRGNRIGAPAASGVGNYGIYFANAPVNFICQDNYIELQTAEGIYAQKNGPSKMTAVITGNTVDSSYGWSIYVGRANNLTISNNNLRNDFTTGTLQFFVYLDFATTTPEFIQITDNTMQSSTLQCTQCIYLNDALSSSTQYIQHSNFLADWTSRPFSDTASCNYDVRNDNYGVGAKTGLVTLTNGGTTTTVTTNQVTSQNVVLLQLANAAAATLNPVYRISAQSNGSFTITHTAGTAAAEQLKWTII